MGLVIAALALTAPPAFGAYPGENGKLAVGREGRLLTIEPDGSGEQALTSASDAPVGSPVWSPDGRRIVFSARDDARPGLFLINADGTCQSKLTPNAFWASWAPDGRRLAIGRPLPTGRALSMSIVDADGTGEVPLPAEVKWQGRPAWSPDGGRIAYDAAPTWGMIRNNADIYVIGPDGTGHAQLTRELGHQDSPDWSPDGRRIAYDDSGPSGDATRIVVMNADGSAKTVIHSGGDAPIWSPDGRKIAFGRSDGDREIFVMNADGSDVVQITHNTVDDYAQSWQPRPSSPAPACPSPPGPPAATPRDTVGPAMAISRRTVRATRRGVVAVRLRCPAAEPAGCRGRLSLRARGRLGSAAFRIPAGRTAAVRVRLSRVNRRLLARLRRMRVTATARAVDQAGNARTTTARFVLRAPRR